jgi:hypothetical protein
MILPKRLIFVFLITLACASFGNLKLLGDLPNSLKEVSATEVIPQSDLIWVIEDSGNENVLYGLTQNGDIKKSIEILNSYNEDWEDLTSDKYGNLYIGDFGNNNKKRTSFKIYKINNQDLNKKHAIPGMIEFTLPFIDGPKDFEAFFQNGNLFYLITKESKEFSLFTVPNTIGKHQATFIEKFELDGKDVRVTSGDITEDGNTVVLLNHKRVWKFTHYNLPEFFSGEREKLSFKHNSQKEGVCFKNDSTLFITDERNGSEGGNIYGFSLNNSN